MSPNAFKGAPTTRALELTWLDHGIYYPVPFPSVFLADGHHLPALPLSLFPPHAGRLYVLLLHALHFYSRALA
jgi:hypothetical protein